VTPLAVVCRYSAAIYIPRGLFHDLAAVAAAHDRHLLPQIRHRALNGAGVGLLDRPPLPRVRECPHDRNGFGGAECHVDPAAAATAGALTAHPLAGGGVAAFHQGEEVIAVHDRACGDPQALQRLGV
jgi:hypothetical protein